MKSIKEALQAEPENVMRSAFLKLAEKDEKGVPRSTGVHHVKLIRGEKGTNKDFHGKVEEGVWLYFEEDGIEKKYFVQEKYNDKNQEDKYGKFYYLFEKFADIEEGTLLDIEFVKNGLRGYVDVRPAEGVPLVNIDEIPVIEEDEVNVKDIPF